MLSGVLGCPDRDTGKARGAWNPGCISVINSDARSWDDVDVVFRASELLDGSGRRSESCRGFRRPPRREGRYWQKNPCWTQREHVGLFASHLRCCFRHSVHASDTKPVLFVLAMLSWGMCMAMLPSEKSWVTVPTSPRRRTRRPERKTTSPSPSSLRVIATILNTSWRNSKEE